MPTIMLKDREWPTPTIDQTISAGIQISSHYGRVLLEKPVELLPVQSDIEAQSRLLKLADDIMEGSITSHEDVAKVIQSLAPLMGSLGSASTEIDLAAFKVRHAILQKQDSFK